MLIKKCRWLWLFIALSAGLNMPVMAASTPAFTTLEGKTIALSELRGKVVLVNFWATSCGICLEEMPDLVRTYKRYHPRGFEVIAVAMHYDKLGDIRNYVRKHGLPFPIVYDTDGSIAKEFGQVNATPTAFLIDASGKRISKTLGIMDFGKLSIFLDAAL